MGRIEISTPLDLPLSDVLMAVWNLMKEIEKQAPPYDEFSLEVRVRDLRMPFVGKLQVPVRMHVWRLEPGWECALEVQASANADVFPHFSGTLAVKPEGQAASRLWLQGEYEPPFGPFGETANSTVLRGVAERSLTYFLSYIAADVTKRVALSELHRLHDIRARTI